MNLTGANLAAGLHQQLTDHTIKRCFNAVKLLGQGRDHAKQWGGLPDDAGRQLRRLHTRLRSRRSVQPDEVILVVGVVLMLRDILLLILCSVIICRVRVSSMVTVCYLRLS